ncbi:MAG TPA: hypothetical protein EYP59_12275 [Thiotrichaceae bacterium]|nr:hypothetical protein [Thiotrichaceae bacterium]
MLFFADEYIELIRFLPDSSKISSVSYVEQLIELMNTYWQPFDNLKFLPNTYEVSSVSQILELGDLTFAFGPGPQFDQNTDILKKNTLFFSKFHQKKFYAKHDIFRRLSLEQSFPSENLTSSPFYNFGFSFNVNTFNLEEGRNTMTEVSVNIFPTQIPSVSIQLTPPSPSDPEEQLTEVMKDCYKGLMTTALESGIVDIIKDYGFETAEKKTIRGKPNWVYLYQKISQFEVLEHLYRQKRSQDEQSILYDFAQQLERVLSLINPLLKLVLPDTFTVDLTTTEEEYESLYAENNQIVREFLTLCDQTLLKVWGEQKLSENLVPLGVSLEDWLKAGHSYDARLAY